MLEYSKALVFKKSSLLLFIHIAFLGCISVVTEPKLKLSRCPELLYAAQDAIEKQKFSEGEFYALRCLDEEPNSVSAVDVLGLSSIQKGDYAMAEKYYDALRNVDPNYDYLHHRLSLLALLKKDYENSRKHFWRAYDLYPVDPQTQHLRELLEEEGVIN